jgi:tetratricopeptide (TPR) repeat protein
MNRNFLFFALILLLCSTSHYSSAQKQWTGSKAANSQSEFDTFFNKAETAYKNGDYFRAKNLYAYCSKMAHPRVPEASKKKDISLNLALQKITAERYVKEGNTFEGQKAYNLIAQTNPEDIGVRNIIGRLNSTVAFKPSEPNKKITPPVKPTEQSTKDILVTQALVKEGKKIAAKSQSQLLFESTYTLGINALQGCNYEAALNHFEKAHKMRPGAAKTKTYFLNLQAIINLEKQVTDLKRSTNSSTEDILSLYERIAKLNAGFELTQSGSACTKTEPDACAYIWKELPSEATKFNCPQILSFAERLKNCTSTPENQDRLTALRIECENLNNECILANRIIDTKVKEAQRLQNQNYYEASNSSFDAITTEIQKLKTECKDFNASDFEKTIAESRGLNDKNIFDKTCRDKQQKTFELALNEADSLKANYEEAVNLFDKIDTNCIDNAFKTKLTFEKKRISVLYRRQQMLFYEAKGDRSSSMGYYRDAGVSFRQALEFAELEIDINRLKNKIELNDCYDRYQGKPCPSPIVGIIKTTTCQDSTSERQTPLQVIVGVNMSSLNASWLQPTMRFVNEIRTGNYQPLPFIGLRVNHQSFVRPLDFNVGFQYTPPGELRFLNANGTNSNQLKFHNVDFDFNLKLHRLNDCRDQGRAYIFAGGNAGYKHLKESVIADVKTVTIINTTYQNVFMGGVQGGFGYEFPKNKLNFEIEYKRQGMIYNGTQETPDVINPFKSTFYLGYLGIKIGYSITK